MRLHLIENKELEETQVTVAYREKDEPVKKIIAFVEHLEESATGAVGLSIFMAKRKMVVLDGEPGLVKSDVLKSIFTNRGIWIYIVLTVVVMVVK